MKKLQTGTRVFDYTKGWGRVLDGEHIDYFKNVWVTVDFCNGQVFYYTKEGFRNRGDNSPMLSLTEYTINKDEFTSIAEFDKPSIGCMGYFWDNTRQGYVSYSRLVDIDSSGIYTAEGGTRWQEFAKEIPQWFLDKMNK
jgi:hypothetical protein